MSIANHPMICPLCGQTVLTEETDVPRIHLKMSSTELCPQSGKKTVAEPKE